jgi:hypothetical protein
LYFNKSPPTAMRQVVSNQKEFVANGMPHKRMGIPKNDQNERSSRYLLGWSDVETKFKVQPFKRSGGWRYHHHHGYGLVGGPKAGFQRRLYSTREATRIKTIVIRRSIRMLRSPKSCSGILGETILMSDPWELMDPL